MFEIKDKVALITGALGGIGSAYTKALLQENVKGVSVIDISDRLLQKLKDELSSNDRKKIIFIKCDITDKKQMEDAYKATIDKFSHLDIVINNAGIFDETNIEKMLDINLVSTIRSTYMALNTYLPKYRNGEEAVIVNTASITGLVPFEAGPVYGATKSGLISLCMSLGTEAHYKLRKTRIIAICPSATNTEIVENIKVPEEYKSMKDKVVEDCYKNLQSVENVGKALVELLKTAANGSIWISQNDEPPLKIDVNKEVEKSIYMVN